VKPSPAREAAHDPASWFPLVAVTDHASHPVARPSVRPLSPRPAVVVRHSPAREEAPEPSSWFPLAELEALLESERLVPETSSEDADPNAGPPASGPVPTRGEIQRRRRRRRNRVRLAVAGAGLGVALLFAKLGAAEADSSTTAEPADAVADGSADELVSDLADVAAFEQAAAEAAATPPPPPPLPNEHIWTAMAQCETGGNWAHYGPTWSGGLGIYRGTWREFGGTEFATLPRDATRAQQIIVAERIRATYGWSAWGCHDTIGY